MIAATLREQIRQRANDCWEYCQLPQACTLLPHEVDHIRSLKHNGPTVPVNLCWSCALCNGFKGSDIASYPADSDEITRLFNPRLDIWSEHFQWDNAMLIGKTSVAIATISLLRVNLASRVAHRQLLNNLKTNSTSSAIEFGQSID